MEALLESKAAALRRARLRAVRERDRSADGQFVFGVSTTGVYCRPSCPSRRARPEHVSFFDDGRGARLAGLRPCLRCRPDEPAGQGLCLCAEVLRTAELRPRERWGDAQLARAGFDPVRVRRAFRAEYGRTFQGLWRERRVALAKAGLEAGLGPEDAGSRAGFESESGLRAAFESVLSRAPSRARGARLLHMARLASPLGPLTAAATEAGLCLLEFDAREPGASRPDSRLSELARRFAAAPVLAEVGRFEDLALQLDQWFAGTRRRFDVPLDLAGTAFELSVWRRLLEIPYGETRSYGELARLVDRPRAARAVGRANARNPLAILVPCHRVVGAAGALTGYAAGLSRKQWLLEHEQAHSSGG
jgi:AraC family transcriptional regulator of adaptative response/methylated-DNA-[protein]-cysteine methyltransferase